MAGLILGLLALWVGLIILGWLIKAVSWLVIVGIVLAAVTLLGGVVASLLRGRRQQATPPPSGPPV
jgi:hypothetical protein